MFICVDQNIFNASSSCNDNERWGNGRPGSKTSLNLPAAIFDKSDYLHVSLKCVGVDNALSIYSSILFISMTTMPQTTIMRLSAPPIRHQSHSTPPLSSHHHYHKMPITASPSQSNYYRTITTTTMLLAPSHNQDHTLLHQHTTVTYYRQHTATPYTIYEHSNIVNTIDDRHYAIAIVVPSPHSDNNCHHHHSHPCATTNR